MASAYRDPQSAEKFKNSQVKKIEDTLRRIDEGVDAANFALDRLPDLFTPGLVIDEAAIRCQSEQDAFRFLKHVAAIPGAKIFNYAVDHVSTYPLHTQYEVQYFFVEFNHINRPYRLEVMYIEPGYGFSPLHQAQVFAQGYGSPVHYSFKCQTYEDYEKASRVMEAAEWHRAQVCHSNYGTFSYWHTSEEVDNAIDQRGYNWAEWKDGGSRAYIKPRLNTRDSSPKAEVSEAAMDYLESKA